MNKLRAVFNKIYFYATCLYVYITGHLPHLCNRSPREKNDRNFADTVNQSRILLLTNVYPSPENLYPNAFVHARVLAYRNRGVLIDVFCLRSNAPEPYGNRDYQGVSVTAGSIRTLQNLLASRRYKNFIVHFLTMEIWCVLKSFSHRAKTTVWVHGSEIQPWNRYDFAIETTKQRIKAKAASKIRMAVWKNLLCNFPENLHLVFVSRWLADSAQKALEIEINRKFFSIIHNPINTKLFSYIKKPESQRKKILAIRPFLSKKDNYANDVLVKTIKHLSLRDCFNDLQIKIIGCGACFDEILEPLGKFENVTIEKRFLTANQIADIHKEYGIFLCPTRMDSHGVSRDEASSSGLVPVTNAVAAIPEFVDESCALLAPPEDYLAMADHIVDIYHHPEKFSRLSSAAAMRVRKQCDSGYIINQELTCIMR